MNTDRPQHHPSLRAGPPDEPDTATEGPSWFSIASVERDTGIGKDTLRVWERRYGFPIPLRNALGERSYPGAQVEKLRVLKRLLDAGHRAGQVVTLEVEELQAIGAAVAIEVKPAADGRLASELDSCFELLRAHDVDALRRLLSQAQLRLGLAAFIRHILVPLNTRVGEAWMRGELQVYQEHVCSEVQQVVLRRAIAGLADPGLTRPRVLLASFPGEPHGLGLLMAEALLAIDGARCVSLGVQVPLWDIALAAQAFESDIVALGFSGCMNPNQIRDGLAELRRKLPRQVVIWAGGASPVLSRRLVPGIRVLTELDAIHAALLDWHRGER